MENAAKALLIAAGVLVGLIVISLIMVSYRQISNYYNAKEQAEVSLQLTDFNKEYIPYNRDDVRGSDLLSLINKIENFNTLNSDEEKINISVKILSDRDDSSKMFYYNYEKNNNVKLIKLGETYTEETIDEILDIANAIESTYTQAIAAKLASNMSTLMGENTRKTKQDLLNELKINRIVDNNEILKYYQYQQFKRAHFNCTELKYTTHGRVKSFTFEFNGTFE